MASSTEWPTIGFVGCGTIATAIVTGLCTCPDAPGAVVVSPRNAQKAAALAAKFPAAVSVAASNQDVVDRCEVVFLTVVPQLAEAVLKELTFRAGQTVVSIIASVPLSKLSGLVSPCTDICRAIPLPAVALHSGVTPVTDHPFARRVFDLLGDAVVAETEDQLTLFTVPSCLMGIFYQTCHETASWLQEQGVAPATAARYTTGFFRTVLSEATERVQHVKDVSAFSQLVSEQTPGGLNEANVRQLSEAAFFQQYKQAMDTTLGRLTGKVALTKLPEQKSE